MGTHHHSRFAPSPQARGLVEHVWVMQAPAEHPAWRALLVPNGRPSVVVSLGEPGERIAPLTGARSPNAGTVAGVRRRPVVLEQGGEAWYVGARLRPHGLALLGLRDLLVDEIAPLDAIDGIDPGRLAADLAVAGGDETTARRLADRLAAAVVVGSVPDDRRAMVERATAALDTRRGLITLTELGRAVGVPAMILDAAFDRYVGIGLDEFTAITRFHHFVGGDGGPDQGPAAAEVLTRYPVGSQTPREVLRFTGLSPADYRAVRDAVVGLVRPAATSPR